MLRRVAIVRLPGGSSSRFARLALLVAAVFVGFAFGRFDLRLLCGQFADMMALARTTEDHRTGRESDAGFAKGKSHIAPHSNPAGTCRKTKPRP
jgi:hypothetical protein